MKYVQGLLIQSIIYLGLWIYDDYVGLVFSLIMASILVFLLVFASVVELIEKSKVPASYFKWMFLSILPPIIISLFFYVLKAGQFDWIDQFG